MSNKSLLFAVLPPVVSSLFILVMTSVYLSISLPHIAAYLTDTIEFETGSSYSSIQISNYNKSVTDNVLIQVPSSLDAHSVKSDKPLSIKISQLTSGTNTASTLIIDAVPPRQLVTLMIKSPRAYRASDVVFLNSHELKLVVIEPAKESPLDLVGRALIIGYVIAVIGTLAISGILSYRTSRKEFRKFYHRHRISQEKQIEKLDSQKKELDSQREILEKQIGDYQRIARWNIKYRLTLLKRIEDFSKELSYWRMVIRQLLLANEDITKGQVKKILAEITSVLKTYTVEAISEEKLKVLSSLVQEMEESDSKGT